MGDIGGAAQAGSNIADTAATDATNVATTGMNDATLLAVAGMQDATQIGVTGLQDAFNASQASKQRDFTANQAQIANQFSAQQADKNRAFQMASQLQSEQFSQNMSDTQMQRRVADLKAANLNPALAMGALGGASSPTAGPLPGSSAQGIAASGAAASSAGVPTLGALSSTLNSMAQRRLTNAQASTTEAQLPFAGPQAAAAVKNLQQQTETLFQQAMELSSRWNLNQDTAQQVAQNVEFNKQNNPLLLQAKELDIQRQKYGLPQLSVESRFWNSSLAAPLYAGQQGRLAAGDLGGAAATAAWLGQQQLNDSTRKSIGGRGGFLTNPTAPGNFVENFGSPE